MNPRLISILDFTYDLPDEKIAMQPTNQRDSSRLLYYSAGDFSTEAFSDLDQFLPAGSQLVFNNSKVINARINFYKPSGIRIEIFCLEPAGPLKDYSTVMSKIDTVQWKCFVGGAAKWKETFLEKTLKINQREIVLKAKQISKEGDAFIIEFSWQTPGISFAEIINEAGIIPLPPYIKRDTASQDKERYQTVFAEAEGSVAAPTAGLHFCDAVFEKLRLKKISSTFVTLHVGAGTFKPVKALTMEGHEMHSEYIDVPKDAIQKLIDEPLVIAVGTTSLRTIETLYWLGVKALAFPGSKDLFLDQWEIYDGLGEVRSVPARLALEALLSWLTRNGQQRLFTKTQLLIVPGYKFRIAKMLITNFHQPRSTLLLLVAAAIGEDWKKVYNYALKEGFRFLSYGDSNLIKITNVYSDI